MRYKNVLGYVYIFACITLVYAVFAAPPRRKSRNPNKPKGGGKHDPDYDLWELENETDDEETKNERFEDEVLDGDEEELMQNWGFHKSDGSGLSKRYVFIPTPESIRDRRFVTVHKLSRVKELEVPFKFQLTKRKKKQAFRRVQRQDAAANVTANSPNATAVNGTETNGTRTTTIRSNITTTVPTTTAAPTEEPTTIEMEQEKVQIVKGGGKVEKKISEHQLLNLTMLPANFSSATTYIQYTHHLTTVERVGDSGAQLGHKCAPKTILETDYCERAAYPNKNKMFCMSVNDTEMPEVPKSTCVCKFYKNMEKGHAWPNITWVQLREGRLNINGQEVRSCLVPKFGVCNHRISTGLVDKNGVNIYEVDVCQGHFQCDNWDYRDKIINQVSTQPSQVLFLQKHCTETDFVEQFEKSVRHKILTCSRPNPRRFSEYDEFKYYCLPKVSRDEAEKHFKPANAELVRDRE